MADFNRDGIDDIVTGPGPGGGPHVRVFDGLTHQQMPGPIGSFFAYDPSFAGGIFVAAGDVTGDGVADVVTGADAGGGPHVKVFNGATGQVVHSFFAYAPSFAGGVRVAVGDVNGDGTVDIITGAGPGGGPHLKVFDPRRINEPIASFFAFTSNYTGGIYVSAADVNRDLVPEIIVSTGPGPFDSARVIQLGQGLSLLRTVSITNEPQLPGIDDPGLPDPRNPMGGQNQVSRQLSFNLARTFGISQFNPLFNQLPFPSLSLDLRGLLANLLPAIGIDQSAGLRVSISDVDGDFQPDILVSSGRGKQPVVYVFRQTFSSTGALEFRLSGTFLVFDPAFLGGLFVSAI
jgi:hypothetical protein